MYNFDNIDSLPKEATSIVRYNEDYGATLVTATAVAIRYQFFDADNILIDDFTIPKFCDGAVGMIYLPILGD